MVNWYLNSLIQNTTSTTSNNNTKIDINVIINTQQIHNFDMWEFTPDILTFQ